MFEVKTTMKNLPLQIGSRHQTEIQVEEQSTRKFKSFLQEEDYTPIEMEIQKSSTHMKKGENEAASAPWQACSYS